MLSARHPVRNAGASRSSAFPRGAWERGGEKRIIRLILANSSPGRIARGCVIPVFVGSGAAASVVRGDAVAADDAFLEGAENVLQDLDAILEDETRFVGSERVSDWHVPFQPARRTRCCRRPSFRSESPRRDRTGCGTRRGNVRRQCRASARELRAFADLVGGVDPACRRRLGVRGEATATSLRGIASGPNEPSEPTGPP